jgi:hypothetical protein
MTFWFKSLTAPQKELNVMRESSQLCHAVQKSGEDVVREILAEPAPGASDHCGCIMCQRRLAWCDFVRAWEVHMYLPCRSKPVKNFGQQGGRISGNRAAYTIRNRANDEVWWRTTKKGPRNHVAMGQQAKHQRIAATSRGQRPPLFLP